MNKPRVIFPYTEAGFGHIMPLKSIADEFERLYGDRVECVRSNFFTETGDKKLAKLENSYKRVVVKQNKHTSFGYFTTVNMEILGPKISTWLTMTFPSLGSRKIGCAHMDELKPDLVVSTHWATNYYANKCSTKPLTALYCPDMHVYAVFRTPADLTLISSKPGYEYALKKYSKRFNTDNLKLVNTLIRNEVFSVSGDKIAMRKKLGFDEDKFTVVLAEGGYGLGKMRKICKIILERDLPVTLVPVCGKNSKLYEEFKTLKSKGKTDFRPMGLVTNIFEILATADLFCGKSGASMISEPCFFGVPQIITKYATIIEKYNGEYYINTVKSAMKIFKPKKVADKIEEFLQHPERLEPYRKAAEAHHGNYGANKAAEEVFALLCTRFPELKD